MESDNRIVTFIKAIDKDYFNSFINHGQVCMNTIKWFRDFEKQDSNIGDEFEGAKIACGEGLKILIANPIGSYNTIEELERKMPSTEWTELGKAINFKGYDYSENANIFSLFAITLDSIDEQIGNYLVPKKFIDEFTNHRFVIFMKPSIFLSKMNIAISQLEKKMRYDFVRYYKLDNTIRENLSYFDKPDKYSYQREFRIIFEDKNANQQILNIGSLKDICKEIDLKKKHTIKIIDNNQFYIEEINQ